MDRDLARLSSSDFDLLVVGGGIYGLATAYDAAQRGLSVALIDRGDFGAATSFNHLKTIHGGLRYLQTADFGRMRESVRERRAFARIAPRFVAPLGFVMATEGTLTRNPMSLSVALGLDALIGWDRNAGIDHARHLPAGRLISSEECRELFYGVCPENINPGAMWYDYQTVQGDRLTLAFAIGAFNHGAAVANYVEAMAPLNSNGTLTGVRVRDVLTDATFDVRARIIVNAAGPWASSVLGQFGVNRQWPLLKAMNLVTSRPACQAALVAPTKAGRALVLLPWQGRTLIGTSESPVEHEADDQSARQVEVLSFIEEANDTFAGLNLNLREITLVHRGIVPAATRNGRLTLRSHSEIIDHAGDGRRELISIVGVKYTTSRVVAERAVDLVVKKLGRPAAACRTADTVLPTAGVADTAPKFPVRYAAEAEMALTLTDAVVRRTGLGAAAYPGDAIISECATAMQQVLGWSIERLASEIATAKRFYEIT